MCRQVAVEERANRGVSYPNPRVAVGPFAEIDQKILRDVYSDRHIVVGTVGLVG